jgi:ankyrin repeat protein
MSNPSWCSKLSQEQLNSSLIDAADGRPQDAFDLLAAGADPTGYPFIMAIQCPAPSIVKAMLARGADPNLPYLDTTPLIRAVQRCDLEMVVLLLAAGADPHGLNSQGVSPMQMLSRPLRTGVSPDQIAAVRDALVAAGGA